MSSKNESKVLKTSIIYIFVSLLNKGIGIITIPIFTRILSASEMGTVTTWISWMTILTPITTMSLVSGSIYIAMNEYPDQRDEYQSSILVLSSISSLVCLIIYCIFNTFLNQLFTLTTPLMIFMLVYLFFAPALDMWLLRQRYEYSTKKMTIVTLLSNFSASIIAVVFVLVYRSSLYDLGELRIYCTYTVTGMFGVFFYFSILRKGKVYYNKAFWRFGIKISIPLIFHTLAKNILDVSDRSMISIYCGKEKVGIYGTVYLISNLSLIVWTAINNAFVPYLYEKLEKSRKKDIKDIRKISYLMILFYGIVCIGLTAVAPEVIKILATEEYYDAMYLIPPIAAGIFLTCVYNLFANVILFHKKSVGVMCGTIIAAVINVGLNAVFIPRYGYVAAAYTTLLAFIVLAISQGIIMNIINPQKLYNIKAIFLTSFLVVMICIAFNLVYKNTIIRYSMIFTLVVLIFLFRKNIIILLKQLNSKK